MKKKHYDTSELRKRINSQFGDFDEFCKAAGLDPIDFTINYPSDIFKYKFNNVLAVYKSGFGGNTGFTFTAYQWYCNGQPIPGATEAVYHTDSAFNYNDIYYVEQTYKLFYNINVKH